MPQNLFTLPIYISRTLLLLILHEVSSLCPDSNLACEKVAIGMGVSYYAANVRLIQNDEKKTKKVTETQVVLI